MALDNLISVAFTPQELTDIDTALTSVENILRNKMINLTPEERRRYASISNEIAQWVQKCRGYMNQIPSVVPGYINLPELDADMQARRDLIPRLRRTTSILESMDDTVLLLGSDVWTNCLAFYRAVKSAAQANVPGTTAIYQDLAKQFPGRPKSVPPAPPNP
jgi:hypothetical protein